MVCGVISGLKKNMISKQNDYSEIVYCLWNMVFYMTMVRLKYGIKAKEHLKLYIAINTP